MSEHDRLAREIRTAAQRDEIVAEFQPQVDLRNGRTVALEALSRWRHPQLGLIPPSEFIPPAESCGAVDAIGDVMLEAACRCGALLAAAGHGVELAVNVAAAQLSDLRFAERVSEHLARWGLPASLLTLELTETRPSPAEAAEVLTGVRRIGAGVSIDDVRTVEEAELRARGLPVSEMKVDRSVIARLPSDGADAERLIAYARDHGLRTVAEGVETEPQLAAVRDLGFDRAQGYLLGRPMPASRIPAYLAAGPSPDAPSAQSAP